MKVLLIHNYYGSEAPSGENTVFEAEKALLRDSGHDVIEFIRHSDEIRSQGIWGALKGAASVVWNPFSLRKLRDLIKREKPDVMHVHNTFPLLSPAIFHAAKGTGTATVLTLHNYRLFCAAGIPMREGKACTLCLDQKSVKPALKYGCYRNSRLATLPLAASIALHRQIGTWAKQVDAFIALTDFQSQKMIDAGLPADKVYIKPHFYDNPPIPLPWPERQDRVVFVGRLGEEKGVKYLIDAWLAWGDQAPVLDLIGEGPEGESLRESVIRHGMQEKIIFHGQQPFAETQKKIAGSRLLVLPSVCFEGFPMVIREAFALGVPLAASRLGSMASLIQDGENGVLFNPGDERDLFQIVSSLWGDHASLSRMGEIARHTFENQYKAEKNIKTLMSIYGQAINRRRQGELH